MKKYFANVYANFQLSHFIEERVVICLPINDVWQEFQNIQEYSRWNSLFSFEQFPSFVGEKIKVTLHHNHKRFSIWPKVVKIEPYHLEWKGKLYLNGLFDGHHQFTLISLDPDKTLFIQSESFSGILVPFMRNIVINPTQLKFKSLNNAFKTYIEHKHFI